MEFSNDRLWELDLPERVEPFFYSDGQVGPQDSDAQVQGCRFGSDGGADLCIEAGTGHVMADGTAVGAPARFVNSSLEQFAESLRAIAGPYRRLSGLNDEVAEELLDRIKTRLREIDPAALFDPENWWAVLFEQMRDGLL